MGQHHNDVIFGTYRIYAKASNNTYYADISSDFGLGLYIHVHPFIAYASKECSDDLSLPGTTAIDRYRS